MHKPIIVFVFVLQMMFSVITLGQDTGTSEITILAKQNLALHSKPDFYSNVLGIFRSGEELQTFGRDADGAWLQTSDGWVNARNVAADGDILTLRADCKRSHIAGHSQSRSARWSRWQFRQN